jgi:hypothetical protein
MSHSIDVDISDMDGGSPVVNYGLLFVLQVGLAGYYVAARYAMNVGGVSPWLFGFIRVSGAALVMTVLTRFFFVGNLNIPKEKSMLMKLIALGIIGGTGPMVFASLGYANSLPFGTKACALICCLKLQPRLYYCNQCSHHICHPTSDYSGNSDFDRHGPLSSV